MSGPLLSTKLYIPPARPRLVEKIKAGMNLPGSFVLLSGPAGFGKTTLLSELIAQLRQPVGWVSLDEGDNDLRWGSRGFQFERPDDEWRFLRVHIRLVAHSWRVIIPNTYLEVAGLIARTDRPVGMHPHSAIYRSPRIVPARKSIKNCSFFKSMSASNTGARSPAGILSVIDRICQPAACSAWACSPSC
jgi:hypothetical protein